VRTNKVKQLLKQGKPAVGTWLSIPSPFSAEFMSRLGWDWLVVDSEHNPMNIETAAQMFMAITAADCAPMVRIPWNGGENIKRVLDAGAWGIVVPMVNSRGEAELAVSSAKYPPQGTRSVGGGRHALSFAAAADYQQHANDNVVVVVQIEHVTAVERADEILSVPGVDACFIGPNDLAASMGIKGGLENDHPRIVEAIEHVRATCQQHRVAPGIHTGSAAAANQRIRDGFQFLAVSSELGFMLARARQELAAIERPELTERQVAEAVRY
jgi:4-hydroxy-2-oxoheptanedioate aldolase